VDIMAAPHMHRTRLVYLEILIIIIFFGTAAQRGLWRPHPRDCLITHNDAPRSVGLLWTNDQPVAESSTLQHTTHITH
jgi:hypothetical protein